MSVLVAMVVESEVEPLSRWGARFAAARAEDLVVVCALEERQRAEPSTLSLKEPSDHPLLEAVRLHLESWQHQPLVRVHRGPNRAQEMIEAAAEHEASLMVVAKPDRRDDAASGQRALSRDLLAAAPTDLVVLRASAGGELACRRILVPAAGGPHAQVALQLADALARGEGARVQPMYVEQGDGEDAEALGQLILSHAVGQAGLSDTDDLELRVEVADDVGAGIAAVAADGYDLILVGASNLGFVRRMLFGTVPERLLSGPHGAALGVIRAAPGLVDRARGRLRELVRRSIPQLERSERISLFEHLQSGSTASMDFITLICLSTAIASLGLIQNSAAVVIGAMLVAPLMTPMLGAGLGLVQGNVPMVRRCARSIFTGGILALIIGFTVGSLTPGFQELTPELTARSSPNLLDLLVALLSGMAAAYALARPGLLEALPGVAIAAALVPPLSTIGISLSVVGGGRAATGAAVLFGTNLVAIILASALTFYGMGVRPQRNQSHPRLWARWGLNVLALTALIMALPLGIRMVTSAIPQARSLRGSAGRGARGAGGGEPGRCGDRRWRRGQHRQRACLCRDTFAGSGGQGDLGGSAPGARTADPGSSGDPARVLGRLGPGGPSRLLVDSEQFDW